MNIGLIKSVLESLKNKKQPKHEEYDVEETEWNETASYLKRNLYIKDITISRNTKYMFAEITELGEFYLKRL